MLIDLISSCNYGVDGPTMWNEYGERYIYRVGGENNQGK